MNDEVNRYIRMGQAAAEAMGRVGLADDEDVKAIIERMQNPQPLPLCMDKECQWQATGAHFHKAEGDPVYGMFGTEVIAFIEHRFGALHDLLERAVEYSDIDLACHGCNLYRRGERSADLKHSENCWVQEARALL